LYTATELKSQTVKELGQLAKQHEVTGWHSMRKDDLVKELVKVGRREAARKRRSEKSSSRSSAAKSSRRSSSCNGNKTTSSTATANRRRKAQKTSRAAGVNSKKGKGKSRRQKSTDTRVLNEIQRQHSKHQHLKNLATGHSHQNGKAGNNGSPSRKKDRLVLMVRDPYWLHALWEVSPRSVQRAQAALAEQWHGARPVLRLLEVEMDGTTCTAERVIRDIDVHGGVNNWYIDVAEPPQSFRVELGYLTLDDRFYSLARSNSVTTPRPGASEAVDENWAPVAEDCERIYAMSGGYQAEGDSGELQQLFEERLRRPMGSPMVTRYGAGADQSLVPKREFEFTVDAEMIVSGQTKPDAYVTLGGQPVKLAPDGSFRVRLSMPDRRRVLPVVAQSSDGVQQRTIVLAVERNTKVMEPVLRDESA